ncbi:aminodeoxychorismate synthase, component I [Aphanomyces invadans]|uniref:aminodeoxychorismate synthase n=1 Tax=Aphanomyces invadans TaxID=157072 RepID=A0A024TSA7_9STRA|nr:aminodeoxychorismate synthase, component I [Aphanomyces invadans]ETV96237.1 aminodeoxychorismate synthase, component I [Aphanomyces invadans]|eukprot:XP_008875029.1 aminodeoxychorismate synthase, component I [Aphanomyces invadans]
MVALRRAPLVQTLLLDNYDSYTYNLFQMLSQVNGLEPVVYTNDAFDGDWDVAFATFLKHVDRVHALHRHVEIRVNIVLSPGPGTPTKVKDFGLCAAAIARSPHVPILGVCLGHQGMAHFYGGKVERAPTVMHGRTSRIQQLADKADPFFFGIPRTFDVVRYHSLLAVSLPVGTLEILATTTEDDLVMAFKHRELPHYGVQFHPESVCSEFGYQMLQNFRDISTEAPCQICPLHHAPSVPLNEPATCSAIKVPVVQPELSPPSSATHHVLVEALIAVDVATEDVFEQLYGTSRHAFWLDSSNGARFSFMGDAAGPLATHVAYDRWTNTVTTAHGSSTESILDYIRRELAAIRIVDDTALPFDFRGGFVGYFGYEVLGVGDKSDLAVHPPPDMAVPDASFLFADRVVVHDAVTRQYYVLVVTTAKHLTASKEWMASTAARIRTMMPSKGRPADSFDHPIVFRPSRSRPTYEANIATVLSEIQAGETYEVCLTNQLIANVSIGNPLGFYKTLRRLNPAPFAGYLTTPRFSVCSSSPERFVSVNKHKHMESKPIKGTRKRAADPDEDAAVAAELAACVKDRAENMMITDLVRNDFGHVCTVGSIHVPTLMQVESFATVHQLVTTVRGQLRPTASVVDAIEATFPGGSMTGAPKKRTMELIRRVEQHPRGVYSGALGYLSINGAADLNIVIRTAVVTHNHVTIGSGGAIVALSDTDDEYDEMLLKTQALRSALAAYTNQPVTVDVSTSFYNL